MEYCQEALWLAANNISLEHSRPITIIIQLIIYSRMFFDAEYTYGVPIYFAPKTLKSSNIFQRIGIDPLDDKVRPRIHFQN